MPPSPAPVHRHKGRSVDTEQRLSNLSLGRKKEAKNDVGLLYCSYSPTFTAHMQSTAPYFRFGFMRNGDKGKKDDEKMRVFSTSQVQNPQDKLQQVTNQLKPYQVRSLQNGITYYNAPLDTIKYEMSQVANNVSNGPHYQQIQTQQQPTEIPSSSSSSTSSVSSCTASASSSMDDDSAAKTPKNAVRDPDWDALVYSLRHSTEWNYAKRRRHPRCWTVPSFDGQKLLKVTGKDCIIDEYNYLKRLQPHENIVTVYEEQNLLDWVAPRGSTGKGAGGMAMEYLPNQLVQTVSDVWELTYGIANALQHIHNNQYVYVDVRRENIRYKRGRFAKLIDFGLCHDYASWQPALDKDEVDYCPWLPSELGCQGWTPLVDTYSFGHLVMHQLTQALLDTPEAGRPNVIYKLLKDHEALANCDVLEDCMIMVNEDLNVRPRPTELVSYVSKWRAQCP